MPSVSDVAVERISLSIFQALYEELERLSNHISTASSVQAERRTSLLDYAEAQPILATE